MTMLIEVEREKRVSGAGRRACPRPSVRREPLDAPVESGGGSRRALRVAGRAQRERDHEWLWLLSAGLATFLIVLLLGLFGTAAPPVGRAAGDVGSGGALRGAPGQAELVGNQAERAGSSVVPLFGSPRGGGVPALQ